MKNRYLSTIILILWSFEISFVIDSVEIALSSQMNDISQDTYEIKNNILILKSNEEYIIKGSCSECGLEIKKETSPTLIDIFNFLTKYLLRF